MVKRCTYLFPLEHLWIEVVGFTHIEVVDNIIVSLCLEHPPVETNVVEVLIVFPVLKVVHEGQFGRVVFKQDLNWNGSHQRPGH